MRTTLAVDAMGGDAAPEVAIEGVKLALHRYPNAHFLLFGDENRLTSLTNKFELDPKRFKICHAPDLVTPDMKPSAALRNAKESSMRLAIEAVSKKQANAVVSAGNTGAYMALSKIILKTIKGIDRPAIAASMPTLKNQAVMLDLGANVTCSKDNLTQFALMGEIFAQKVLGKESPSVGLLNIGAEDLKGNPIIQETYATLREKNWLQNFCGFIEGNDIFNGNIDVIVTDGFAGNIALKTAEGTLRFIETFFRTAFKKSFMAKIGYFFIRHILKDFKRQLDPRRYNGAPFLGLNGIAVKSHGGTDAVGFSYALGIAIDMVDQRVNECIYKGLECWSSELLPPKNDNDGKAESSLFMTSSPNHSSSTYRAV